MNTRKLTLGTPLLLAVLLPWGGVAFAAWAWSNIYPVVALKRVHQANTTKF